MPVMHVKIGPVEYEILPMADDAKCEYRGLCDHVASKIYIDMSMPHDWQALTLVHEILHAIFRMGGYDEEGMNEKMVKHVASLLYQVLNENQGLWINAMVGDVLRKVDKPSNPLASHTSKGQVF